MQIGESPYLTKLRLGPVIIESTTAVIRPTTLRHLPMCSLPDAVWSVAKHRRLFVVRAFTP